MLKSMIFNTVALPGLRGLAFFTLFSVFLALLLQPADANQFKRVRDVNVACNDALLCNIYISNRSVSLSSFGFRRSAAPQAPVQLVLSARPALRGGSVVIFTVDGERVLELDISAFSYRAATYEYLYGDQDSVIQLMQAVRKGDQIQIAYETRSGRSIAPFSLSGITAGFIYADEVQGRIGAEDALMALSANVPAESLTVTGQIVNYERWSDVPAQLEQYFGQEIGGCDNVFRDEESRSVAGGFSADLGNGDMLIVLPCGGAGAYNYPYAFWQQSADRFIPLPLPVIASDGPTTTNIAWNIVWDGDAREVYSFIKGRGLGDCGASNRWRLTSEAGLYRFVLIEALLKEECDGVYREDFSDYERLWPVE